MGISVVFHHFTLILSRIFAILTKLVLIIDFTFSPQSTFVLSNVRFEWLPIKPNTTQFARNVCTYVVCL